MSNDEWWLEPIHPALRDSAVRAAESGDVAGFLGGASNADGLMLAFRNLAPLRKRGMYEPALIDALTSTSTNNYSFGIASLRWMIQLADRKRLREAGDPLPSSGPFTVYRGVAGVGRARHVRGLSWTASLDIATWFAARFPHVPNPAVYRVTVDEHDILTYSDQQEQEFIVLLPKKKRPKRILDGPALQEAADELKAARVGKMLNASAVRT